jgi:hypothetical protein
VQKMHWQCNAAAAAAGERRLYVIAADGLAERAKIVKLPLASEGCIYIRADGQRKMQLLQLLRLAKKHKVAMALAEKLWRFSQL